MVMIGKRNTLRVLRDTPPGLYLDGGNELVILLPGRYIPPGTKPGDLLDVFVYLDSEDRLVAPKYHSPWSASLRSCGSSA